VLGEPLADLAVELGDLGIGCGDLGGKLRDERRADLFGG
jgi:hypothetical protein